MKDNLSEGKMPETKSSENVYTGQRRIADLAKRYETLTALNHFLDMEWMDEAFRRTRKDGAKGVDGQSGKEFEKDLGKNLQGLLGRRQGGKLPGTGGGSSAHPQGQRRNEAVGDSDLRGQGASAGGDDGVGGRVRAGFPAVQLRLPARTQRTPVHQRTTRCSSEDGGWVDSGTRYQQVLRYDPGPLLTKSAEPEGARWSHPAYLVAKWLHAGVMEDGAVTYPRAEPHREV